MAYLDLGSRICRTVKPKGKQMITEITCVTLSSVVSRTSIGIKQTDKEIILSQQFYFRSKVSFLFTAFLHVDIRRIYPSLCPFIFIIQFNTIQSPFVPGKLFRRPEGLLFRNGCHTLTIGSTADSLSFQRVNISTLEIC